MAAEGDLEKETVVHRQGYEGFITLLKWGTALSLLVAAVVILVISN